MTIVYPFNIRYIRMHRSYTLGCILYHYFLSLIYMSICFTWTHPFPTAISCFWMGYSLLLNFVSLLFNESVLWSYLLWLKIYSFLCFSLSCACFTTFYRSTIVHCLKFQFLYICEVHSISHH